MIDRGVFTFEEFQVDLSERVLAQNGRPIVLTPKAFHLLEILLTNHGRIVEKDALMAAIWKDSFVEDGNLAYTVNSLRKSLGDVARDPRFIETVPRRGYRFIGKLDNTNGN